jgi:hypothetical protein
VNQSCVCELYGLHLTGAGGAGLLPGSGTRRLRVTVRHAQDGVEPACLGVERASLDLPGGRQLQLRRAEGTATFTGPPLSHDELVHPYLGAAASVFSRWAGREVFHAGAFVLGGLAWAVVGGREAGKSSLLAALAARRLPVLADDLVVTDSHQAFCGPRTVDLRRPLPGSREPLTPARGATRWRLWLPPLAGAVPLGGWIYLRWDAEVAMSAVPASVSLARLAARRTWPALPSAPETLLVLAARPAWDLARPADWARSDEAIDLMLRTLSAQQLGQRSGRTSSSPAPAQPSRNRATSSRAAAAASRPNSAASASVSSSAVTQSASRSQSIAPEGLSAW